MQCRVPLVKSALLNESAALAQLISFHLSIKIASKGLLAPYVVYAASKRWYRNMCCPGAMEGLLNKVLQLAAESST